MKSIINTKRTQHAWLGIGLLLAGAALAMPAQALVYTVGPSSQGCDYIQLRDALDAAEAAASGEVELHISYPENWTLSYSSLSYNSEVVIENPAAKIVVIGGYADCTDPNPVAGQYTILHQNANSTDAAHSLLGIANDNANPRATVEFHHIKFEGPDDASLGGPVGGGALDIKGHVSVLLDDSWVTGFHALFAGGGISVSGSGSDKLKYPTLTLSGGSEVSNNTVVGSGGGIFASKGRVIMRGATVADNSSDGNGGGLYLTMDDDLGPIAEDTASLLMDDAAGPNVIHHNTANADGSGIGRGGGIYSDKGQIFAQSRWDDAFQNVISSNRATWGGGIYIKGSDGPSGSPYTDIYLYDTKLYSNGATDAGGGMYLRNAVYGVVGAHVVNTSCTSTYLTVFPGFPPIFYWVPFTTPCSLMQENYIDAPSGSAVEPGGGAIYLDNSRTDGASRPSLRVYRTYFRGNRDPDGLAAVAAARNDSVMRFRRSIFTHNDAKHDDLNTDKSVMVYSDTGKNLMFHFNTVLDSNTSTRMFYMDGGQLDVTGSILWGSDNRGLPFHFVWYAEGGATMVHNDCIMVRGHDNGTAGVPAPIDPSLGFAWGTDIPPRLGSNFAPSPFSPALDYCDAWKFSPEVDAYFTDVVDVPSIPNIYSTNETGWDLGAVEQNDVIFAGGFGQRPYF